VEEAGGERVRTDGESAGGVSGFKVSTGLGEVSGNGAVAREDAGFEVGIGGEYAVHLGATGERCGESLHHLNDARAGRWHVATVHSSPFTPELRRLPWSWSRKPTPIPAVYELTSVISPGRRGGSLRLRDRGAAAHVR